MQIKPFHFKTKISLFLSITLIIVIVNKIPNQSDFNLKKGKFDDIHLSDINFVNPIFINDTDPVYNWSKTATDNDWCSGTGSFSDPYVIKNIIVNGNGLSNSIEIQNSNKYFIIKNSTLYNSSVGHDFAGISLENVNNSLIFKNNISHNNGHGIRLMSSFNNTILQNIAQNNTWEGIFLRYSANNTIRNNTVMNNHRGIRISNSVAQNIVENNYVYGHSSDLTNSVGIGIYFSQNMSITNNNILNNTYGIYLTQSANNTIMGNTINSNKKDGIGMQFSDNDNNKFLNNIIFNNSYSGIWLGRGKKFLVRNNTIMSSNPGITIWGSNNVTILENKIINCSSGIEVFGNNITITRNNLTNSVIRLISPNEQISSYNITRSNLVNGRSIVFYSNELGLTSSNFSSPGQIILYNVNNSILSKLEVLGGGITTLYCYNLTMSDNSIQGYNYGLSIVNSYNITVNNNTIFDSLWGGIDLLQSDDCNITKNFVFNNYLGIELFLSHNNSLIENKVRDNLGGLVISYSNENKILKNSIHNSLIGIVINSLGNNNSFLFNDIVNSSWNGFRIIGSSYNLISRNIIKNSSKVGLGLDVISAQHKIYNNTFISNTLNAQDNGTNNQWDNGIIGNFWDDYTGNDLDSNGIGDTQYNISGLAKSVDRFPQIIKKPPQIIIENPNINDLYGYNPPEINLTITGLNIDTIWYSLTNETYSTINYTFIGEINQSTWNSIGNGSLSFNLYVNNSYGLIGNSEVNLRKDVISPLILIHNPIENQEFYIDAPFYNITILEPNLETIWYTIDNGNTNITITELTGNIYYQAWESAPNGLITIRFYVQDKAGNLAENNIIIIKSTINDQESKISGYNLIIVSTLFGIILIAIFKKRRIS